MTPEDKRGTNADNIRFERPESTSRANLLVIYPELAGLPEDLMKIVVTIYENVDEVEKSLVDAQSRGESETQTAAYAFIRFTLNVILKEAGNPLLEKFIKDYQAKIDQLVMESELPVGGEQ